MEDRGRVFLAYSCLCHLLYNTRQFCLSSSQPRHEHWYDQTTSFLCECCIGGEEIRQREREREKKPHFFLLVLEVLNKFCLCMRST